MNLTDLRNEVSSKSNGSKLSFDCITLSPLFLGEAKPGMVELRTAPIKAGMRFWWRALNSHLNLSDLKKKESKIFGGTDQDGNACTFDITISDISNNPCEYNYPAGRIISPINYGSQTGLQYLFYSIIHLKKKGQYFQAGTSFNINFKFNNANYVNEIISSFWMLINLGSLGERARRGAGSLAIRNINGNSGLAGFINFFCNSKTLIQNINVIKNIYNSGNQPNVSNDYSIFIFNNIYLSSTSGSWTVQLEDIGEKLKSKRLDNKNHHIISANQSAAFGMPVLHTHANPKFTVLPACRDFNRRASPFIIKLFPNYINGTDISNCSWMVVRLDGNFLPSNNNNNGIIKKSKRGDDDLTLDQSELFKFFNSLPKI